MKEQRPEDGYQKALNAAAKQLSYRALSGKALREKLVSKGIAENEADYAVAWLETHGMLDDRAFAASVVRSCQKRGYGVLRVQQELRRRGIEREMADEVLQDFQSDSSKIFALLDKRLQGDLSDKREVERAVAALQRRGHRWDDIREALRAYGTEIDDDFS